MRFVKKSYRPFDNDDAAKKAEEEAAKKFAEEAAAKGFVSQDTLNSAVASEKRTMAKKLEELQANFKGTQKEKEALAQQVEQLKSQFQTAEEKAKDEWNRKLNELTEKEATSTKAAEMWKTNYASLLKRNEILRAATKFEAFNPDIIVTLLAAQGDIVETIGDDGTPTGNFEAKFKVSKKSKDGKLVELSVNAEDAVKFMTEMPETYGSLFKNTKAGGAGGNNNNGAGGAGKSVETLAGSGVQGQSLIDAYRAERGLKNA